MLRSAARQLAACVHALPACQPQPSQSLWLTCQQPINLAVQYAARAMCSSAASTPIYGACILERSPVIVPDEPAWENEYLTWREQLQQRYYKEYPPQFLAGKGAQQDEAEQDTRTQFQPAPRITEADHNNDRKSLWRKLDQRLYLLVKERGAGSWRFPQQQHREGESIRQTIERAIGQVNSKGAQLHFLGNMPHGHLPASEGAADGTLFFMRALLIQGEVAVQGQQAGSGYSEHLWVTKEEVPEYVEEPQMQAFLDKLL